MECTPNNVLYAENDEVPVFIDYETVLNFPIPVCLVKYHFIQALRSSYILNFDDVFSKEEVSSHLEVVVDVLEDMQKAYYHYYYCYMTRLGAETDGALSAIEYLYKWESKSFTDQLAKIESAKFWWEQYSGRQQAHIELQNAQIEELRKSNEYWEQYSGRQQTHIELQSTQIEELRKSNAYWERYSGRQQAHIELQNAQIEELRKSNAYWEQCNGRQQAHIELQNTQIEELRESNAYWEQYSGEQQAHIDAQNFWMNEIKATRWYKLFHRRSKE
jgi:hypothetical protein